MLCSAEVQPVGCSLLGTVVDTRSNMVRLSEPKALLVCHFLQTNPAADLLQPLIELAIYFIFLHTD